MLKKTIVLIVLLAPTVLVLGVSRVSAARVSEIAEPTIGVPCAMSLSKIKLAIRKALRGKGWIALNKGENYIKATLHIRRHTLEMKITYNTKKITMTYVRSNNLNYREMNGKHYIHGNANFWITTIANLTELNMTDNCN